MKSIILNFLIKSLYGLVGAIAAALLYTAQNFHPDVKGAELWIWNSVIIGLLTGLAGFLKRCITPGGPTVP